jgi:hypothetical protein
MCALLRLPYIVVDSNQLRVRDAIEPLLTEFDRTGQRIMLPWTSTYELTKGNGNNFVASVQWLQQRPAAVSVAYATLRMFQEHELRFVRPVVDVTHPRSTENLRGILAHLADGSASAAEVHASMVGMAQRASSLVRDLDSATLLRAGTDGFAKDLPPRTRGLILAAAAAGDREPLRRWFLDTLTPDRLHKHLVQISVPFTRARRLARWPSFAALNLLGAQFLSLRWAVFGGIENTRALENDGVDLENVILALHGRDFISKDRKARDLYEDLHAISMVLWR